jgi:hypothetical protein
MFLQMEYSFLFLFAGKKVSKNVDAQRKLVDLDSEEELAAAQNMTFHPDDPGKNIELFFGTEGGGGEVGDYVWIVQAA